MQRTTVVRTETKTSCCDREKKKEEAVRYSAEYRPQQQAEEERTKKQKETKGTKTNRVHTFQECTVWKKKKKAYYSSVSIMFCLPGSRCGCCCGCGQQSSWCWFGSYGNRVSGSAAVLVIPNHHRCLCRYHCRYHSNRVELTQASKRKKRRIKKKNSDRSITSIDGMIRHDHF